MSSVWLRGAVPALAVVIVIGGSGAVLATSPPPPGGELVTVVDDTGLLTVDVPAEWDDITTEAGAAPDGSPQARIIASPNVQSFSSTFSTPGVLYTTQPFAADTETALRAGADYSADCTDLGTAPYADEFFTGTIQQWAGCGGTTAQVVTLLANPQSGDVSVVLVVALVTPGDLSALAAILRSFDLGEAAQPPAGSQAELPAAPSTSTSLAPLPTAPDGPPTTPAGLPGAPGASTLPVGPGSTGDPVSPAAGATTLVDDTNTFSVDVPDTWSQVDTRPFLGTEQQPAEQPLPAIAAAPDLETFNAGTGVGVWLLAIAHTEDLAGQLATQGAPQCVAGEVWPYDDQVFVGFYQVYTCDGIRYTTVAANTAARSDYTMTLGVATLPADEASMVLIAESFDFLPVGAPTAPTTAAPSGWFATSAAAQAPPTYDDERLQFEPGADSGTRTGSVAPGSTDRWLIDARAGQFMQVMVDSVEDATVFSVFAPDRTLLATVDSSTPDEHTYWEGTLPASGDYAVEVTSATTATPYDIKVAIDTVAWVPLGQLERLSFAPGASSGTVGAAVLRATADTWYVNARAGQHMTIELTSLENNSTFDVFSVDGSAMTSSGEQRTTWSGPLTADGDHTIEVRPTRGNATYTMTVTITGPPTPATAPTGGASPGAGGASGGTSAHVYFEPGSDHAQIQQSIAPGAEDRWVITANSGQTLTVLIDSDIGDIVASVYAPDGEPLRTDQYEFSVEPLPSSGDYVVTVDNTSTIVGAYDLWIYVS